MFCPTNPSKNGRLKSAIDCKIHAAGSSLQSELVVPVRECSCRRGYKGKDGHWEHTTEASARRTREEEAAARSAG